MVDILTIENGRKVVDNGMNEEKVLLNEIDLTVREGDFIITLGGDGAGKSTLFNTIADTLQLSQESISFKNQLVTKDSEEKKVRSLFRVFQDPKMGTIPRMTVAEDLLPTQGRGQKREFHLRSLKDQKEDFFRLCQEVGNGLEQHLDTPAEELSGGQRQALSLLMATITAPELLLLDEHTAALDPKTTKALVQLTSRRINEQKLTCLMITYRTEDVLKYGGRLIVLQKGKIIQDLPKKEKQHLTAGNLLRFFEEVIDRFRQEVSFQ